MSFKSVEFICEEIVAARGTPASPRPADRPRPSLADLKAIQSGTQSFGDATDGSSQAQPPMKRDASA